MSKHLALTTNATERLKTDAVLLRQRMDVIEADRQRDLAQRMAALKTRYDARSGRTNFGSAAVGA